MSPGPFYSSRGILRYLIMHEDIKPKSDLTRSRNRCLYTVTAVFLAILVLIVAINSKTLLIAYHKHAMLSLISEEEVYGKPFRYHQVQLISYGVLESRKFVFENINRSSAVSDSIRNEAFSIALSRNDPFLSIDFSYAPQDDYTNLYFAVVDAPKRFKQWETFVTEHDKARER